jgi:hypothetical protein
MSKSTPAVTVSDIDKAIAIFSANTSLFPPSRLRLAEISSEHSIPVQTLREVVAKLTVGLLAFVEPEPEVTPIKPAK